MAQLKAGTTIDGRDVMKEFDDLITRIGNNEDLNTTQKASLILAINEVFTNVNNHKNDKNNPHNVTVSQIGAVPTSRTISAGDGLSGGGDLSANRTLSVDSTVVRTSGNQSISGIKHFQTIRFSEVDLTSYGRINSINYYFDLYSNYGYRVFNESGQEVLAARANIGSANDRSIRLEGLEEYTTSQSPNVYITNNYHLARSTSSKKYKMNIKPIEEIEGDSYFDKILNLIPKGWYDKKAVEEYAEHLTCLEEGRESNYEADDCFPLERYYGLIAEDLEEVGLERFLNYRIKDGEKIVEGIQYDKLWTLLIPIIKSLKQRLDVLENEIRQRD